MPYKHWVSKLILYPNVLFIPSLYRMQQYSISNLVNLVTDSGKESGCMQETQGTQVQLWLSPLRRKWQQAPVFSLWEIPGPRSLKGYSPRGCEESDRMSSLMAHFNSQMDVSQSARELHARASSQSSGQLPSPKKAGEMRSRLMAPPSLEPMNMLQDNEELRSQEESRMLLS